MSAESQQVALGHPNAHCPEAAGEDLDGASAINRLTQQSIGDSISASSEEETLLTAAKIFAEILRSRPRVLMKAAVLLSAIRGGSEPFPPGLPGDGLRQKHLPGALWITHL